MRTRPLLAAIGIGLALPLLAAPTLALAAPAKVAAAPAKANVVEPEATEALRRMSAYLATLPSVELTSETSLDLVTESGQRLQFDGTAKYKIRRPNGFVIDVSTDLKKRKFFYDGKSFTVFAPELGFYATVPAPPTNIATLDTLWEKYGIALPLEDLFRWNDASRPRREALTSGFDVGPATLDGVETEHYAFREGDIDWQVWIRKADPPLPLKLVIIDRSDPADPAYIARLTWNLSPKFDDADFAFHPDPAAKSIRLTAAQ